MKEMYAWVPWFSELSKQIAQNDSSYLVDGANGVQLRKGDGTDHQIYSFGDENIDPFSFIYAVASKLGGNERHKIHDAVADEFTLPEKLPLDIADALIFPQGYGGNLLFHDGVAFAPKLLSNLFRTVVEGIEHVVPEDFESAQNIPNVAATKLTQALFLINPLEFLPFDKTSVNLLRGERIANNRISLEEYREFIESAKEQFPGCSLYEINALAYLTNRTHDKLQINPSKSWLIGLGANGRGEDSWQQFDEGSNVFVAQPRGGISWSEFDPNEHELGYPLKDPRSGDIVYVREGTVGRGIGVVYKNDYVESLNEDSRIHVLWLCKDNQEIGVEGVESRLFERSGHTANHFRSAYPTTHYFLDSIGPTEPDTKRTWLLLWNPKRWEWDSFEKDRLNVLNGGSFNDSWSCSNASAKTGDRVFLMRLGEEPKGIIAAGSVVKDSYVAPHFSGDKDAEGETQRTVGVEFYQLQDPKKSDPYIRLAELHAMGQSNQNWTPQQSGIEIRPMVAIELEKMWGKLFEPPSRERYQPLNTILYGPPGTGKTHLTMSKSVEICDGRTLEGDELRDRYAELVGAGRIAFITFHQSYGYEEFVEGIRPIEQDSTVVYRVTDGVLKRIVKEATSNPTEHSLGEVAEVSFDMLWDELSDYLNSHPNVRTPISGTPYRLSLGIGESSIKLEDEQGTRKQAWSRERAKEVWSAGQMQAPDQLTATKIGTRLGIESARTSGSYLLLLYTKLWQHAQNMVSVASRTTNTPENYVLIIDEINRANVSKVLGELITLLEEDKRQGADNGLSVKLPYSGDTFELPSNVYIIGTMNTADRSIALLDTALRRRFDFEEMPPRPNLLIEAGERTQVDLPKVLETINERLEYVLDRDHLIGHAWLMKAKDRADLDNIMRRKIIPLVAEYFYDDWNKVLAVFGSSFIARKKVTAPSGLDLDYQEDRYRWKIQDEFQQVAYEQLLDGVQDTKNEDEHSGESA